MKISAKDPLSDSVDGAFSVAVYDKLKVPNTTEYPVSIVNYLLLTSDLNGHIENPGYYFSSTNPTVSAHVDLLMRTQGWRRFTWENLLNDEQATDQFSHERVAFLSGER